MTFLNTIGSWFSLFSLLLVLHAIDCLLFSWKFSFFLCSLFAVRCSWICLVECEEVHFVVFDNSNEQENKREKGGFFLVIFFYYSIRDGGCVVPNLMLTCGL